MNLWVPDAVLIKLGKLRETLLERNLEHAWSDKDSVVNIHCNECSGVFIFIVHFIAYICHNNFDKIFPIIL